VARPIPSTITSGQSARGLGASGLAAVGWGLSGVFASLAFAPGLVLTFYRSWIGAGLLTAAVLLSGRRITWALLRASALGGILLGGDMALFFSSIKLTSVAVATVIGALQPALVILIARPVLGERVDRRTLAWTALAIAGVGVIVIGAGAPSRDEAVGDLLAVGSLLCWAGYFVASKRARPHVDALDYTAGVTIVAALTTTVLMLVFEPSPGQVRAGDWVWIGLLAVIPTGSHVLMNWAHRYLYVSISSVVGSASPIVAAVGAWIILGQRLDALQIAGGAVGVAAIGVVGSRRGFASSGPLE
jgi:drug/metabolite transporter (DMT)-like permease